MVGGEVLLVHAQSTLTVASLLATRKRLSETFSSLRRVRPRVPFFQLAAHRIPTRWSLYRGLLHSLPRIGTVYQRTYDLESKDWQGRQHGHYILWWIRRSFRKQRSLTSPKACRQELLFWHKLLDMLQLAATGNSKGKAIVTRYEGILAAHKERLEMEVAFREEMAWADRMRNRAIMTGGYMRPSFANKPLPRFYRQPIHISGMMRKRVKAKERRLVRQAEILELLEDLKPESIFLTGVMEQENVAGDQPGEDPRQFVTRYGEHSRQLLRDLQGSFDLETARATSLFSPEMIATIKRARKYKIENKTRERQREKRGEMTNSVRRKSRQKPPPWLWDKMSQKERELDRIAREVSWGGHSGAVKRKQRGTEEARRGARENSQSRK